jgi:hypothetical protein
MANRLTYPSESFVGSWIPSQETSYEMAFSFLADGTGTYTVNGAVQMNLRWDVQYDGECGIAIWPETAERADGYLLRLFGDKFQYYDAYAQSVMFVKQ